MKHHEPCHDPRGDSVELFVPFVSISETTPEATVTFCTQHSVKMPCIFMPGRKKMYHGFGSVADVTKFLGNGHHMTHVVTSQNAILRLAKGHLNCWSHCRGIHADTHATDTDYTWLWVWLNMASLSNGPTVRQTVYVLNHHRGTVDTAATTPDAMSRLVSSRWCGLGLIKSLYFMYSYRGQLQCTPLFQGFFFFSPDVSLWSVFRINFSPHNVVAWWVVVEICIVQTTDSSLCLCRQQTAVSACADNRQQSLPVQTTDSNLYICNDRHCKRRLDGQHGCIIGLCQAQKYWRES